MYNEAFVKDRAQLFGSRATVCWCPKILEPFEYKRAAF